MQSVKKIANGSLLFLYNHDAGHQLSHTVGILRQLAKDKAGFPLVCAVGNAAIANRVIHLLGDAAGEVQFYDLSLPSKLTKMVGFANRVVPAERVARLIWHAKNLRHASMIISPERTCLHLKRKWRGHGPKFLYIPHGSGDRSVAYHPALAQFDYMLVSGQKVKDELVAHGLAQPENIALIGYPKFDVVDRAARPDFFNNGKPTFVYNPHFDPYLSSWYDHGPAIINWFAHGAGREFNLIFAPHVMLFRKNLHISPEYGTMRRRPELDPEWEKCPNILIDVDSERLFDMSYTLGSDAYIGDVSSQINEFLLRPRALFFIDTHNDINADAPYPFWKVGERFDSVTALTARLPDFHAIGEQYRELQIDLFNRTFSVTEISPSSRGAQWLQRHMDGRLLRAA